MSSSPPCHGSTLQTRESIRNTSSSGHLVSTFFLWVVIFIRTTTDSSPLGLFYSKTEFLTSSSMIEGRNHYHLPSLKNNHRKRSEGNPTCGRNHKDYPSSSHRHRQQNPRFPPASFSGYPRNKDTRQGGWPVTSLVVRCSCDLGLIKKNREEVLHDVICPPLDGLHHYCSKYRQKPIFRT